MTEPLPQPPDAARTDPALLAFIHGSGLVAPDAPLRLEPLTGGVASDIWKVSAGAETFVVKKALEKLRVKQDWHVPVSRNAHEVAWLTEAAKVKPRAVPEILWHDERSGAFAMTWLDPAIHPVWKTRLRDGETDARFAARVGATLAEIHAATANSSRLAGKFAHDQMFMALRLDPYFLSMRSRHPDLAGQLERLTKDTLAGRIALVHGDVSPKNILQGPDGPVFLDAECAWYGDPAFDLAFCLNHLLLKCLWVPDSAAGYLACFRALADAYRAAIAWEPPAEIEARAARLLPALMLARIDGKSPVEYITEEGRKVLVREFAAPLLASPPLGLEPIAIAWARRLVR